MGYAGEDVPKFTFPTMAGCDERKKFHIGDTNVYTWKENFDIKYPYSNGQVTDWDVLESLWDYSYSQCFRTNSSEHPLLYSESAWNSKEDREKLIEIAFEKYNVPGFFLARNSSLSAFASGKSTALVIDAGASHIRIVPIHDGYVLRKGIQRTSIAGDFLSEQIIKNFEKSDLPIIPQYLVASKSPVDSSLPAQYKEVPGRRNLTLDSYHEMSIKRVANDFKETVCAVSETPLHQS